MGAQVNEPEDAAARSKRGRPEPRKLTPKRGESLRRAGRLTIAQALDDNERVRSLASLRRSRERERRAQQGLDGTTKIIRDGLEVLAKQLGDACTTVELGEETWLISLGNRRLQREGSRAPRGD